MDLRSTFLTLAFRPLSYLQFFQVRDFNALDIAPEPEPPNINVEPADQIAPDDPHLIKLITSTSNRTSIAHLNTQAVTSSFAEFEVMMSTYKFDIVTLSETCLKDNKLLLEHVTIPGYKF